MLRARSQREVVVRVSIVCGLAVGCILIGGAGLAIAAPPVSSFPAFVPLASSEGVAVDKVGNVYVSIREGGHGKILRFGPTGQGSLFADLGLGDVGGLAVDAPGNVYAATPTGVVRVSRRGTAVHLPGTERIVGANALAFDSRGNLYVTESSSLRAPLICPPLSPLGQGGLWRITPQGDVDLWLESELLSGTCTVLGSPVGANGIVFHHGALYIANTEKGLILRVPILPDGTPGLLDVWVSQIEAPYWLPPTFPIVPDGLSVDVHGNIYAALVACAAVVRFDAVDRSQETIARYNLFDPDRAADPLFALLDTPASLAFGTGKGGRTTLFVTNLGWGILQAPRPGLTTIDAGVPGLPLP
jgi:sugar lactone lactonase YvrE